MTTLNIEGVGRVNVSDDFLKLSPDQQHATVDDIVQQLRASNVAADIQKDYSKMSAGQLAKETISNIPSSAVRFGESVVQPVLHPIQTAENIALIGKGTLQKLGIKFGEDATPYADAVGKFLVDRYGSVAAIKKTIATDPVGLAADISTVLTGGGSLAARAPGIAGKLGEAASAAGRVTNPLSAVVPAAKIAAEGLGITTGAGSEAIRTAARAGAEGGEASEAFLGQMRGTAQADELVSDARSALAKLRQQRGAAYVRDMASIKESTKVLPFDNIDEAVDKVSNIKNFKGKDTQRSTAGMRQKIADVVDEWRNSNPAEFHTAEGLDALKQTIGDLRDDADFGKPARAVADEVYHAIRKTIVDEFPKYGETMKGYETATQEIKEIEKTLSLNPKASVDTALRKITSALRDNVNTNFGNRKELVQFLARSGAKNLLQKIAGQALKGKAPRGVVGQLGVAALGYESAALAATNPLLAAKMAALAGLSSPRLVGEAAHLAGRASRTPFRQAGLGLRLFNGDNQ